MLVKEKGSLKGKSIIESIKAKLFKNVLAEEKKETESAKEKEPIEKGKPNEKPKEPTSKEPTKEPLNYEDLISRARKEERNKLYPQIDTLKKEKTDLVEKHNNALIEIGNLKKDIEEKEKIISDLKNDKNIPNNDKDVDKLEKKIKKLETELDTTKTGNKEFEEALRKEYEVKLYRLEKLGEVKDKVIPELITGTTKEEIDASIEVAKKRYEEIEAKILKKGSKELNNLRPNNGSVNVGANLNIEDVMNLDPSSEEYKEFRKKIGLR